MKKIPKRQLQTSLRTQPEEINQKTLAKEGRLKRYPNKGQAAQTKQDIKKKENSSNKSVARAQGHINNRIQKKENNFEVKYENGKTIKNL